MHRGALGRQLLLSPAPSAPSREAQGRSNAASPSLSRTLERRGYTGTEEKSSEAASRPSLEHVPDFLTTDPRFASRARPACDGDVLRDLVPPACGAVLSELTAAQVVNLAALSANGVALLFVATLLQPLVFAHVNGLQVLGAELPVQAARSTPMRLLEQWAEMAFSANALATTFMIGRYCDNGPRLGVCLLPYAPPTKMIVRTAAERRRRLGLGATVRVWCSFLRKSV